MIFPVPNRTPYTPLVLELLGLSNTHLVSHSSCNVFIHKSVLKDFVSLCKRAERDGIQLTVASSYRDFFHQKRIWDGKALGQRDVLDDRGSKLNRSNFSDLDWVFKILRWSALPGASRHHWGTDMDVFDGKCLASGEIFQMLPNEIEEGGVFEKFNAWLTANIGDYGFDRPYEKDRGGVAPEWWHLSHRATANEYLERLQVDLIAQVVEENSVQLKECILPNLEEIFSRFVKIT